MPGVVLVGLACLAMSIITWKAGARRHDKRECSLLQKYLKAPRHALRSEAGDSRPERLIRELADIRQESARVVDLLNETLNDVDYETRGMQDVARACSRVSMTAGMAGACVEVALRVETSTARAAVWGVLAAAVGIAGAVSCAVIGQWATRGMLLRRRLWDEFVHSMLNSEFLQTAWTVRAPGLRPTSDLRDGQDT